MCKMRSHSKSSGMGMYSMWTKIRPRSNSHISNSIRKPKPGAHRRCTQRPKVETICNDPKNKTSTTNLSTYVRHRDISNMPGDVIVQQLKPRLPRTKSYGRGINSVSFNVVCSCSVLPRSALLENRRFLVSFMLILGALFILGLAFLYFHWSTSSSVIIQQL